MVQDCGVVKDTEAAILVTTSRLSRNDDLPIGGASGKQEQGGQETGGTAHVPPR